MEKGRRRIARTIRLARAMATARSASTAAARTAGAGTARIVAPIPATISMTTVARSLSSLSARTTQPTVLSCNLRVRPTATARSASIVGPITDALVQGMAAVAAIVSPDSFATTFQGTAVQLIFSHSAPKIQQSAALLTATAVAM